MNENFRQGVAALKAGDRAAARRLLGAYVRQAPNDPQAWLWLSGAVERDSERIFCLRQVLQLDPANQAAQRGLAQILNRQTQPPSQAAAPTPPPPAPSEAAPPSPAPAVPAIQRPGHPNARFLPVSGAEPPGRPVFRARPSLAQALSGFWAMALIVWLMNGLLQESALLELALSTLMCSSLGMVMAYLLIVMALTRYELTTRRLAVTAPGRRLEIPIRHILRLAPRQNWLQARINTGDLLVEAALGGELRQVRLHNISGFQKRLQQFQSVLEERL